MKNLGIVLSLLFFITVSQATELAEFRFNEPHRPEDEDYPLTYQFFDPEDLVITNDVVGGRLTQVVNPYTVTYAASPIGGAIEHVKVLQLTNDVYSVGENHNLIRVTAKMAAQHFGMDNHPFPDEEVIDPEDDVRLGSCALNLVSMDTFMVFDFMITNHGIYALYERLPFARNPDYNYRSFTQMKRLADRDPDEINELTLEYDAGWNRASWYIDGKLKFQVHSIGKMSHSDHIRTMIDLGGVEEVITPGHFKAGFGCFTLLDAVDYHNPDSDTGLVNLCGAYPCGYVTPSSFIDTEDTNDYNRLWGQGSALTVLHMEIENF